MGKKIDKNISKNVSVKYRQKLIDHAKKSATDAPKTTSKKKKKQFQKQQKQLVV